jgi:RNA polymerase sigma-70 factor (ECF subfamily)
VNPEYHVMAPADPEPTGMTPTAFVAMFDEHAPLVLRYARSRVGSELAEDVVSEAFAVAWRARGSWTATRGDARAWILGIATNVIHRHREAEARWLEAREQALARGVDRADVASDVLVDVDRSTAAVVGALRSLSPKLRDPLLLHTLLAMTYEDIAKTLEIPVGTVRSRISRARRALEGARS